MPIKTRKTVGSVAVKAIKAGKSNEAALEAVKSAFPRSHTSLSSIAWYRNRLRQDGERVRTAREMKRMTKKRKT